MEIPMVDFKEFLQGDVSQRKNVSKELVKVVRKFGFVYLKNHGIENPYIEKLFELNKQFFEEPIEYKIKMKKSHETFCGYDALLEEQLTSERPGDLKESYMFKQFDTPWPDDWTEFKEFMMAFHQKCYELALKILKSFAIGLNIDETFFDDKFEKGENTIIRLLHYPPISDHVEKKQIRAGEHTDYGALTILFQDSIGGLEVKTLDNKWRPAPYHQDTVLINIGDCMEMWTNGLLRSTPHRVVNPNDDRKLKPRYSAAFFCDPDLDVQLNCIDKFVTEQNNAKYMQKTYKEHLRSKYVPTYSNINPSSLK